LTDFMLSWGKVAWFQEFKLVRPGPTRQMTPGHIHITVTIPLMYHVQFHVLATWCKNSNQLGQDILGDRSLRHDTGTDGKDLSSVIALPSMAITGKLTYNTRCNLTKLCKCSTLHLWQLTYDQNHLLHPVTNSM